MASKSPPLRLQELHQLQWLLGCLLVYASAGTMLFLELEEWFLFFALLAGATLALLRPAWLHRLPSWVPRAAFPVIVVIFASDLWLSGQVMSALIRLTLVLLLYRCLSPRGRREDLQLILLGLFLLVVAGVLTVSLSFAFQLLLYSALSLLLLYVITVTTALELAHAVTGDGKMQGNPSWLLLLRRVFAVFDWRLAGLFAGLFVGLVCVSALLFVSIPRFQFENSLFLERFLPRKTKTGFSESVRFGQVTEIVQDSSLALSVDPSDARQLPATPYFRMLVLDEYTSEGGFRVSARLKQDLMRNERQGTLVRGNLRTREKEDSVWTFYLEAGVSRFLPLPGPFTQFRLREPHPVQYSSRFQVAALRLDPVSMVAFRMESPWPLVRIPDREFALRLVAAARSGQKQSLGMLHLDLPLSPEDRRLVDEENRLAGLKPGMSANDVATVLGQRLALRHAYSLSPGRGTGSADPLIAWLRSSQPGHCELFAGAFVLQTRAAGFPCRLVVGFRGGSWNTFSNSLSVRNSDAHAWCELWDGEAWLRVDPTPGASLLGERDASADVRERRMDSSWEARLNSLRVFWYRRIVNFDQRTQLDAVEALRSGAESSRRFALGFLDDGFKWLKSVFTFHWSKAQLRLLLLLLGLSLLSGWGLFWLGKRWRWRLVRRGAGKRHPVRREAGRLLRRMEQRHQLSDAALLDNLRRLRFGPEESWPKPEIVFKAARRSLR